MSKKILNIITYVVTFGLCAFLVWYSVKDVSDGDIEKMKYALSKANYILLIPILIMGIISHWSRAVRWKILMEPLEMYPKTANAFMAVMIGYLANLFLPRLGEVIKCTLLAKYEKIATDKLIGTIITERAFDMLCLVLLFVITFFVQIDLAGEYLQSLIDRFKSGPEHDNTLKYIILACLGTLITLGIIFKNKIANTAVFIKFKTIFTNIISGIMSFRFMKNKKGFVFHTLLIWTLYLSMILLGFKSIEQTSMLGINTSLSVLSFGSIGMIVTPGGIGAYTLLVDEIVRLYGIEKAFSLAISWIIWLVPTLIIFIGGLISLFIIPIYNRKKYV